jgi:hypothetical protein
MVTKKYSKIYLFLQTRNDPQVLRNLTGTKPGPGYRWYGISGIFLLWSRSKQGTASYHLLFTFYQHGSPLAWLRWQHRQGLGMVTADRGASRRVGAESQRAHWPGWHQQEYDAVVRVRRRSTKYEGGQQSWSTKEIDRSGGERQSTNESGDRWGGGGTVATVVVWVVAIAHPYCTLGYPADPMSRPTLTQHFSGWIQERNFTVFHFFGFWAAGSAHKNLHPQRVLGEPREVVVAEVFLTVLWCFYWKW